MAPNDGPVTLDITHTPAIHILPPELVVHIFSLCLQPFRPFSFSHKEATEVLRLGSISSYYRNLVYSTPSLWATATFFVKKTDNFDYIPTWLNRTGSTLPLQVRLETSAYKHDWDLYDTNNAAKALMKTIQPYLHRCLDIDLRIPSPSPELLPTTPNALPLLEYLSLHVTIAFHAAHLVLNLDNRATPNLRKVELSGVWLEEIQLPWSHLQFLRLDRIFPAECITALNLATQLSHLTLSSVDFGDSVDPESRVVLPHLETLEWFADLYDITSVVLSKLHLPSLKLLCLCPPDRSRADLSLMSSILESTKTSLQTIISMNLAEEAVFQLWSQAPAATVVHIKMWDALQKVDHPSVDKADILSVYDTPLSLNWPDVLYFLPALGIIP